MANGDLDSSAERTVQKSQLQGQLQLRTRIQVTGFMCSKSVMGIIIAQPSKGPINRSVKSALPNYLSRYPGNTRQYHASIRTQGLRETKANLTQSPKCRVSTERSK
jgi:hypothetical protein